MTDFNTSFGKVTLEDYTPPAVESDVQPLVDALIEAGEGKVAHVVFATEKDAITYKRKIQKAFRSANLTALVSLTPVDEKKPEGSTDLAARFRTAYKKPTKKIDAEVAPAE